MKKNTKYSMLQVLYNNKQMNKQNSKVRKTIDFGKINNLALITDN